jgi:hypothetical protein
MDTKIFSLWRLALLDLLFKNAQSLDNLGIEKN